MADANSLAMMMYPNDRQTLGFIEKFGTEERNARITTYYRGAMPNAVKEPVRYAGLQSELMAGLVEIIEPLVNQPKRGPGRPRKVSQDASMDRPADTEAVAAD